VQPQASSGSPVRGAVRLRAGASPARRTRDRADLGARDIEIAPELIGSHHGCDSAGPSTCEREGWSRSRHDPAQELHLSSTLDRVAMHRRSSEPARCAPLPPHDRVASGARGGAGGRGAGPAIERPSSRGADCIPALSARQRMLATRYRRPARPLARRARRSPTWRASKGPRLRVRARTVARRWERSRRAAPAGAPSATCTR